MELVGLSPMDNKDYGELLRGTEGTYCINEQGFAFKSNEKLLGGATGRPFLHKLLIVLSIPRELLLRAIASKGTPPRGLYNVRCKI